MKRFLCMLALAVVLHGADFVIAQNPGTQPPSQPSPAPGGGQGGVDKGQKDAQPPAAKAKSPVSINDPKAFQGYTLISPMSSKKTMLIDMQGKVVHSWDGAGNPALCAYLLPNGNLLRTTTGG